MAVLGQRLAFAAVPSVLPFIESLLAGLSDLWRLMWDGMGTELQNILIGVALFCLVYLFILRPFVSTGYFGASDTVSRSIGSYKSSQPAKLRQDARNARQAIQNRKTYIRRGGK